jgi:hypothetical protein
MYWRDRRNDCAHGKDLGLGVSHVESLYYFAQGVVPKLRVSGSLQFYAGEVVTFYDVRQTPPGQDPAPLIGDISTALTRAEKGQFPQEVALRLQALRTTLETFTNSPSAFELAFFAEVLSRGDVELQAAVTTHIVSNQSYRLRFFRKFPAHTRVLVQHPALVRPLWYDDLFSGMDGEDLAILASMFRNNLIPAAEHDEASRRALSREITGVAEPADKLALLGVGFYRALEELIVADGYLGDFDRANKSRDLIGTYILDTPISPAIAQALNRCFSSTFHPWHLKATLEGIFAASPNKRAEYHATGVAVPAHLVIANP